MAHTDGEFTRGPWEVADTDDGGYVINGAEGYVQVATVSGVNQAEALANARLMAASKELLAGCTMALDALSGGDPNEEEREEAVTALRALIRKLNDAVPPPLEKLGWPG